MKRNYIIGIAVVAIALIAFLIFKPNSDNQTAGGTGTNVAALKVGYPVLRIGLPVFVAQEQGIFEKHGLQVEMVRFETAQPMMDALVGGSLDIGGFCALPITFSAMARSKTPLAFVGSMMEDDSHSISLLLIKPDSEIKSIQDLKGKRIGILPTRAYEVWLQKILSSNGVDPTEVIIQQVPPPQQALALQSGSVDALFTNDPAATAAQVKAGAVPLTPDLSPVPNTTGMNPFYFGSFNVKQSYVDSNPDVVRRLSLALDEAIDFIRENPEKAKEAMKVYLPAEQQGLIDKFPNSNFRKTNETTQEDLDAILAYYKSENILAADLDLSGAQYKRAD